MRDWTEQEINLSATLRREGMTYAKIGEAIGRNKRCVQSKLFALGLAERVNYKRAFKGAVSLQADLDARKKIMAGSHNLKNAIADYVCRYANDNQVGMAEALNRLLCGGEAR